jgi:hypothetical protein
MESTKNSYCDLHIHSAFSDSDADIESIFKQAKSKNLSCIAITDHDTVSGLGLARSCSVAYDIRLIEAIELSTQNKDIEVHILGYFIDPESKKLLQELSTIKDLRRQRLLSMAEALNSLGLKVDTDELMSEIGTTIPTRLHLALYLLKKNRVFSLREAFRQYLSPGRPAYRARFKHSVKEGIRLIKDCGGLAFLAHPHMIPEQSWIEDFVALGIDGLELVYPSMSGAKSALYKNMALKYGLLQSGGSDAHGSYKEFTKIGDVRVPYEWVKDMESRLQRA